LLREAMLRHTIPSSGDKHPDKHGSNTKNAGHPERSEESDSRARLRWQLNGADVLLFEATIRGDKHIFASINTRDN